MKKSKDKEKSNNFEFGSLDRYQVEVINGYEEYGCIIINM